MEINQRVPFIQKSNHNEDSGQYCEPISHAKHLSNDKTFNKWSSIITILLALCLLVIICIPGLFLYTKWFGTPVFTLDLLEVKKCPGCVGQSLCSHFYNGEIQFSKYSKPDLDSIQGNEGIFGFYENQKRVLIRHFGSPAKFGKIDEIVCSRGQRQGISQIAYSVRTKLACFPHLAIWRWLPTDTRLGYDAISDINNEGLVELPINRELFLASHVHEKPSNLFSYAPATRCLSERLFGLLQNKFLERTSFQAETRWLRFDELMFLFNLAIDPQAVIIQSFTRSTNWPFPNYLGACGRWTVEDYHGVPLSRFSQSPLWVRLRILRNILHLPVKLERAPRMHSEISADGMHTDSYTGYAIYLNDFDLDSLLLIDPLNYDVTISNLRHAIIVDTQTLVDYGFAIDKTHLVTNASSVHLERGLREHKCLGNISYTGDGGVKLPCLSSKHADELCAHIKSDHNYWTICSVLFHDRFDTFSANRYFFDSMPNHLIDLLQKCVYLENLTRQDLFLQMIQLIDKLIDQNPIPYNW